MINLSSIKLTTLPSVTLEDLFTLAEESTPPEAS